MKKKISGPCRGSDKSEKSVPGFSMRVSGIVVTEQYRCLFLILRAINFVEGIGCRIIQSDRAQKKKYILYCKVFKCLYTAGIN